MELKKYKLGEILDVTRGTSLSGEFYATEGEYIRLTCGNFDYQNNCFKENKSKDNLYYTGDFRSEFLMEKGDIITPLTEQAIGLLGSTAIIPESGKYIQSQDVAKIICKENLLDRDFAFYLISSNIVKQQLSAAAQQTKIRHTSPDKIKDCTVWIPELAEQRRIGKLLRSLDRKIELNRAINQNLEAMAKQLYDYWFVQFDFPNENGKPYKSSGGAMVWNNKLKREIPEGWNVLKLGERCSFNKRTSSGYFNHPILYLDTSNITNNTINELQFLNPSSDIIPSRARRLVQEGDIVYSTVRPNLKHFGIIMNPDYNMVVSTGFAVITANWSAYRYFIYQFLIQATTIENLSTIAQSAVSAYPSINTSDIENLDLVVPPDSMIEEYAKTACRLHLQIDANYKEIKSITKQRDELLPLLMNGQVLVNSDLILIYLLVEFDLFV